MIKELVKKNRSYRRFYQEKKLTRQQLMELVETARLTPSAANRQPFKYRIVCDEEENEKVFRLLGFAGYLKDRCAAYSRCWKMMHIAMIFWCSLQQSAQL